MTDQANPRLPEVWLRGPVPGVPGLLQPAAHALLQAKEEIQELLHEFPVELLWDQPAGLASPAFHLQHIVGVLDRLFTYADGRPLSHLQLKYLSEEGLETAQIGLPGLLHALDRQVDLAIEYFKTVDEASLRETRTVGRKQLPSTKMGLIFHAAEHTMRHTGQLLVTVKVLRNEPPEPG